LTILRFELSKELCTIHHLASIELIGPDFDQSSHSLKLSFAVCLSIFEQSKTRPHHFTRRLIATRVNAN